MYDYEFEDEYEEKPRHRKMAKAKKDKVKKADHKHEYKQCVVSYVAEDIYGKKHNLFSKAQYCTVCGKLDCNWMKTIDAPYGSLPVFETEMWGKAVKL